MSRSTWVLAVLVLVAGASMGQMPAAQASCYGPRLEATVEPSGQLVVAGKYFGTNCYDTGDPPTGQGILGPPATDIALVMREAPIDDLGIEWQIAQGDANADYTFEVDVSPPPVSGSVTIEARFAEREGLTSFLVASVDVTLAESVNAAPGATVATFGRQPTDPEAAGDESSLRVPPIAVAALVGGFFGAVAIHGWLRRRTGNRR